jgi:hypothetical protein
MLATETPWSREVRSFVLVEADLPITHRHLLLFIMSGL